MRYATWTFSVTDDIKTTPLLANGITFLDDKETQIIGYLDDTADITQMTQFSVVEISQSEALTLLTAKVPNTSVSAEGVFIFPNTDKLAATLVI